MLNLGRRRRRGDGSWSYPKNWRLLGHRCSTSKAFALFMTRIGNKERSLEGGCVGDRFLIILTTNITP
jgi:hypothetical protein